MRDSGHPIRFSSVRHTIVIIVAAAAVSCSGPTDSSASTSTTGPATTTSTSASGTTLPELTGGGVDLALTRDDVDCSPEAFGDDETIESTVAHYVVDGNLGSVCFGEPDDTLVDAWTVLASIVPGGQLHDLVVFTGFDSHEEGDDVTLAFVSAFDIDGSVFQMSVNVAESAADPAESQLTMMHEFAHVFTGVVTQIDRFEEPETCDTYWNGEGCFLEDSVIQQWIDRFWLDYIDDIDPDVAPTVEDGERRCDIDPGFFGPYAASNPEEDFAETFSAFVFRIPAATEAQQEKLDWIGSFPGLAEFRTRAVEAGFSAHENTFAPCG